MSSGRNSHDKLAANYLAFIQLASTTLVVLRVVLTAANGEQDKLLQPVLIGAVAKRNVRGNGIGG
jgi:hypothetical protein